MKNEPNKEEFFNIINEISNKISFRDSDGSITLHQIEAIEKYGGFLSLAPKEDKRLKNIDIDPSTNHVQIAHTLLSHIRDYNLSVNGYRFTTLNLTSKEKQALKKDLKIAEEYLLSIEGSPSKQLVSLVEENIKDYKAKLAHECYQDDVIIYKDFPTIPPYKDKYQAYVKLNKTVIIEWLKVFVEENSIEGYSRDIKSLVAKL